MNTSTKNRSARNTYYEEKKYRRYRYHQEGSKEKAKQCYENNKETKQNITKYLIKKE